MITLDLFEKKLSQLNQQHVSKTKDLEKAMHSQGIDPGEPKRDAKTPRSVSQGNL